MFDFIRKKSRRRLAEEADRVPSDIDVVEIAHAPICPIAPAGETSTGEEMAGDQGYATQDGSDSSDSSDSNAKPEVELTPSGTLSQQPGSDTGSAPITGLKPISSAGSGLAESIPQSAAERASSVLSTQSDDSETVQQFQMLDEGVHTILFDGAGGGQIWPFASIKTCLAELCGGAEEIETDDRDQQRILVSTDSRTGLRFGLLMEMDGQAENIIGIIFICILSDVTDVEMHTARLNDLTAVSTVMEEDGNILIAARPLLNGQFSPDLFRALIEVFLQDVKSVVDYLTDAISGQSMYTTLEHFFGNESLDLEQLQNIHRDGSFARSAAGAAGTGRGY